MTIPTTPQEVVDLLFGTELCCHAPARMCFCINQLATNEYARERDLHRDCALVYDTLIEQFGMTPLPECAQYDERVYVDGLCGTDEDHEAELLFGGLSMDELRQIVSGMEGIPSGRH